MKLNKREKTLAIGVGAATLLGVVVLVWQYGFSGGQSLAELQTRHETLAALVDTKQKALEKAKRAAVKLDEWQRRSLPADAEKGSTLYRNWLSERFSKAGFRGTKFDDLVGQSHRGVFEEFRYTIKAQASLTQLTQFLWDFYSAGHLHKIANLQITPPGPAERGKDLELNITVEALSLADADRRDELTKEPGNRLLKKSFDDYRKTIVDRNVFAAYTPPKASGGERNVVREAPKDPPKPKFDHLEFTKLTGITEIDGQPVAWIETKTTGKAYKARAGEELDIASAKVKILRIGVRDIELQIGDEKRTIGLGQNLLAKP